MVENKVLLAKFEKVKGHKSDLFDNEEWSEFNYFAQGYNMAIIEQELIPSSDKPLNEKKINDLLNWIKSDLSEEENVKISKTMNPYRTEKLRFLRKLKEVLTTF